MAISDRLTKLSEDITSTYNSIEDLGGTIPAHKNTENIAPAIESIYSRLPKTTGTGSNITLTPTLKGRLGSVLNGDTYQQTYSGKNLFNKNSITSGYLIEPSRGTESANASYGCSDYIPVKANTQYTRVYCNNWYGAFYDENKNYVETIQNQNVITPSVDGYARISFLLTNKDIVQLEQGSTATSYEPYTGGQASPNPDYPQEIQCVEGIQNITVDDGNGNSQTQEVNLGDIKLYDGDYITGTPDNWNIINEWKESTINFNGNYYDADSTHRYAWFAKPSDSIDYNEWTSNIIGKVGNLNGSVNKWSYAVVFNPNDYTDIQIVEKCNGTKYIYKLATPTTTPITDTTLISQLNNIYKLKSYDDTTNISVSGNLPMIIEASALKGA